MAQQHTRRDILKNGWKVCGAFLGIAAGWTGYESLRPLVAGTKKSKLALGKPSTYGVDTATYVPEGRLYMVNAGGHVFALSQKCPHLGCRVPFCESSGRFECACHGSVYDLAGEYVAGPAPRGMDQYPAALENGVIVVDLDKTLPGPERGAKAFLTPPKGPACKPKG